MKSLLLFIRLSRPLFLLGAVLLYSLGAGISFFLGLDILWGIFLLGLLWAMLLQLSAHYLNEYFNATEDQDNPNRTPFSGGSGAVGPGKLSRQVALLAGLTCLAFLASLTVVLIAQVGLDPLAIFIMLLAFLGSFFYSIPPVSLERSGYGELTTSILVAFLLPAFSFVLQTGELHRFVAMSTFPLVILHLAMMMAFELPDYASDVKYNKRTLLVRLGWRNGMNFHNLLIISAYLLLLIEMFLGLPKFVVVHAFISLPIAVLQIWQVIRIERGSKPNWSAVTLNALASFGAMAYFMIFAYYTH
jgi:1,4-dihydroxy-2-naphthoate octaprenyltransferase